MTYSEQIAELEKQISIIENNHDNVCGGMKAWSSGLQTYLKPGAEKKVAALNKKIAKLYELAEDVTKEKSC